MSKTIVFVHGMFQNPKSWDRWVANFKKFGYQCVAPAWPFHEGEPAALRKNAPEGIGDLGLAQITQSIEHIVASQSERPILIGHSVGGLIVQLLVNKGMVELGVCISPVAPNRMLSFDWGFIKNSVLINNPLKGNEPFYTDLKSFHASFCNTMSMEETKTAFQQTATHDSRNVLRDCMGPAGKVDVDAPHVPLLFVTGEMDQIIPATLVEKNAKAYTDPAGIVALKIFPGRTHFICGEPGWGEVTEYIRDWIQKRRPAVAF